MKQELTLFFTAVQFYTRIPSPRWVVYKPENLSLATRYLPLIGWILGTISGLTWFVGTYLSNVSIGLLLSMITSIFTTGAFHEDGFADVCDGFGGGWTHDKILEIMKDSRVGTYGAVGLILILGLKFLLLQNLALQQGDDFLILMVVLISGHAVSRLMPVFIIFTQPYARADQDSKAKPVAQNINKFNVLTASFFAVVPILVLGFMTNTLLVFLCIVLPGLFTFFLARYFRKWIGGYTGDCLGAIQQVSEVSFYISLTILWKFI